MLSDFDPFKIKPDHTNYISARESLSVPIPPSQQKNVIALFRHEKQALMSRQVNDPRQRLLNFYVHEEDRAVYVVFQGGEFQGFNNRRAMARFISICRKNSPGEAILVHRMGSKVDFDLVNRLDVMAITEPEKWVRKDVGRIDVSDDPQIIIELFPPPDDDFWQ